MTRARDIANIIKDANFSGTLDVTGASTLSGLAYPTSDGSANQFIKTDGSGSLAFAAVSGTTINSNADNRIISGSGTANTLNGEANLTFNGTTLGLTGNQTVSGTLGVTGNHTVSSKAVFGANSVPSLWSSANNVIITDTSSDGGMAILSGTSGNGSIMFSDTTAGAFSDARGLITYLHASDAMRFMTANAERMRIDSAGKVGIGTASPSQLLEIHGASNPAVLIKDTTNNCISYMFSQDSVATFGSASNHPVVFNVNNGEKVRIDAAGKVGLGINPSTLPSFVSHAIKIANGGGVSITSPSSGDNRYIFFGTGTSSSDIQLAAIKNSSSELMFLGASGAERMRIDSAGKVGIGTTSPAQLLSLSSASNPAISIKDTTNNVEAIIYSDDSSVHIGSLSNHAVRFRSNNVERMRIFNGGQVGIADGSTPESAAMLDVKRNSGDIVYFRRNDGVGVKLIAGNQSFSQVSDETKKENIAVLNKQESYDNIKNIRAVNFNFKDIVKTDEEGNTTTYEDSKTRIGFISQDWETNYSELVDTDNDGVKSLLYTETVPVLLSALQKAQEKIEALTARITALEGV